MAFPPALKEKEEVREGEADEKKAKKSKGKKKKDTEIEKGPVASEGVTKANRSPMPTLDSLTASSFRGDGCGCDHKKSKKDAAKADGGCSGSSKKKKGVWADGFTTLDAETALTQGAKALATDKYKGEKRKRNAQGQPHNVIYAQTFNT
jgi:hypothetical protein